MSSDNGKTALKGMAGYLKGAQEDKRNQAYQGAEIAKTQYGYLTGQGMGNPYALETDNAQNKLMQGITAGQIEARDRQDRQAQIDALKGLSRSNEQASPYAPVERSTPEQAPEYLMRPQEPMRQPSSVSPNYQESPYVLQDRSDQSADIMNSLANSMLGKDSRLPVYDQMKPQTNQMINTGPMYANQNSPYSQPGSMMYAGVR